MNPNEAAVLESLLSGGETGGAGEHIDLLRNMNAERLEAPDALANAALYYAANGVAVFPLKPGGKTPITASGFKDATTHELAVRNWWAMYPSANIGAPTGRLFDVIDLDGYGAALAVGERLQELFDQAIGSVLTPRDGGLHIYVPHVAGRRNTASRIAEGVDTRGEGGYVVLPPSITDRRYVWLRPLEVERLTAVTQ